MCSPIYNTHTRTHTHTHIYIYIYIYIYQYRVYDLVFVCVRLTRPELDQKIGATNGSEMYLCFGRYCSLNFRRKTYKLCIFCEVMTSKCPSRAIVHNTGSMKGGCLYKPWLDTRTAKFSNRIFNGYFTSKW
jgi:hypothetical protein